MDRLRAHVVATAVLTAALAALPLAMQKPTSAASTSGVARPDAATRPSAPGASVSALLSTTWPDWPDWDGITLSASMPAPTATPEAAPRPPQAPAPTSALAPAPAPTSAQTIDSSIGPVSALVPFPCSDAHQVGSTAYMRWHGMVAFSVKQFYSRTCHSVYGYAYPWFQFRALRAHYVLGLGVFDLTHDAIVGARTLDGAFDAAEFWSAPFSPTADSCTEGLVHVFLPDTETDTFTDPFCAS